MKPYVEAAEAISAGLDRPFPHTAIVLGSGLGRFHENMQLTATIDYADIPHFPVSTVAGHAGRLLVGRVGGLPLACMQGRMHYYEGYSPSQLAVPVRTLHQLGVNTLVVTNAAGGIAEQMGPGTLMMIDDHINLSGRNPLSGPNDDDLGVRFPDMSCAWDKGLRETLVQAGVSSGVALQHGVYMQITGPNFETPAEIRMMGRLGADVVGMSTVPECLVARHAGMRVAGLSVITNWAAGLQPDHELTHEETIEVADAAYQDTRQLLLAFFAALAAE